MRVLPQANAKFHKKEKILKNASLIVGITSI